MSEGILTIIFILVGIIFVTSILYILLSILIFFVGGKNQKQEIDDAKIPVEVSNNGVEKIEEISNSTNSIEDDKINTENKVFSIDHKFIETLDKDIRDFILNKNEIYALRKSVSIDEAFRYMSDNHISQCPIYDRSIDDIMGILKLKDLSNEYLNEDDRQRPLFSVEGIVKDPPFIDRNTTVRNAIRLMVSCKSRFAIVIDTYGQTIGLISLHDLISIL